MKVLEVKRGYQDLTERASKRERGECERVGGGRGRDACGEVERERGSHCVFELRQKEGGVSREFERREGGDVEADQPCRVEPQPLRSNRLSTIFRYQRLVTNWPITNLISNTSH